MSKDFAFQFCPGDYLRDTQCLSERTQVAYDRIMCEHIRNISTDMQSIWIAQETVSFFAKRLNEEELVELYHVLKKNPAKNGGFQIEWVAKKVAERAVYIESRTKNGLKEKTKAYASDKKAYAKLPDSDNDIDSKEEKKGKRGKGKKPILDLIPKNWPQDKFLAAWSEFAEIRMKKKKPLTENAISRAISVLIELSKSEFLLAEKIILQSVDHGWDSFYPLKNQSIKDFHHPVTGQAPPDGKGYDKRGRLWPLVGGRLIDEA